MASRRYARGAHDASPVADDHGYLLARGTGAPFVHAPNLPVS
jgi:hypothetical protein